MGFVLTPAQQAALIAGNPSNAERIFPYLGGAEVNSSPRQDFDRYVISFGEMELEEAERWPDLLSIVREKVKPERDKLRNNADGRRRKQYWWQFGRWTPALYAAIEGKQRCLVISRVTKHVCFTFQPVDRIFSEAMYVFPLNSFAHFAALQSRVHEAWARLLSSSMRNDLRYSASDCFDTFPFPPEATLAADGALEHIGQKLYEVRAKLMVEREQGLTTTYNQLKDPDVHDPAIDELRALHLAMDRAVLAAYGWTDIEPPAFPDPVTEPVTDKGRRAKEAFDDEVIDRLFALNAERAAEEQTLGLTANKARSKKAPKPRKPKPATKQLALTPDPDPT